MSTIFARPTLYRGIQMRSRLEAAWAEQFDALGWEWQYEPVCLGGPEGQYLPDFVVLPRYSTRLFYFEVKGGWWEDPVARGIVEREPTTDDPRGYSIYDVTFAERKLWSTLVTRHDPEAIYVIAAQHDDTHNFEAWRPGEPGSMCRTYPKLVRCPLGCTGFAAFSDTYCGKHCEPWALVELVPSLHGQQWAKHWPRQVNYDSFETMYVQPKRWIA